MNGQWVFAGSYTYLGPDQPRTYDAMVHTTGERAAKDLRDGLVAMAVNSGGAAVGGATKGATAARAVTRHGLERVAGAAATRGGVLSSGQIHMVRLFGRRLTSSVNGATVRVLRIGDRFHVVIDGERGFMTSYRGLSQKSLDRLASKYGWH